MPDCRCSVDPLMTTCSPKLADNFSLPSSHLGQRTGTPWAECQQSAEYELVVEVRYEGGASVYVNYTDEPATVNGVTIEAQNFTVGGDGE